MTSYYVQVNECQVNQSAGANWWALFRARHERTRVTVTDSSVFGDVVRVACEDRADADSLHALLVSRGIHPTALKIRREVAQ